MKKWLKKLSKGFARSVIVSDNKEETATNIRPIGLVLSGGGARGAYQVGALKALIDELERPENRIMAVVGSSIGAVNGILFSSGLKYGLRSAVAELEELWLERTYRNTFSGTPTKAFFNALKIAILRYSNPGPQATDRSIFDPTPLIARIDSVLQKNGGITLDTRNQDLELVGVMTTIEGDERKPLLFANATRQLDKQTLQGASFDIHYVSELTARHGLASAALPSVLPPVHLDTQHGSVRLVDGGICDNIPVDPAVRFGADKVIVLDVTGRQWWLNHYGKSHDTPENWEVPSGVQTYCLRPPETFIARSTQSLGSILQQTCSGSRRDFMQALGPTWPIFSLIKRRLGEDLAYEVMSYVALHPDYIAGLIECGYNETRKKLGRSPGSQLEFSRASSFEEWYQAI